MKLCTVCGKMDHVHTESDPEEYLTCGCYKEEPRTYWTVIVPWVDGSPTPWHPTDKNFSPLSRGNFKTQALAVKWARNYLDGHPFSLKECPRGDVAEIRFDHLALSAAIGKYLELASIKKDDVRPYPILRDTTRAEVCEWLWDNYPLWSSQFSMDLVEHILARYHGAKSV